ncbi:MAG: sensor histidine kinase [Massiliimalia sp.]|jgi:two-component system sensor histidine kinase BraS/BceS
MKFLLCYVKQYQKGILVFLLFSVIFLASFFLYDLPLEAVLYPMVICGVLGFLFLLWEARKAKQKHRRLQELCQLPAVLMNEFPEMETLDDQDYQNLIESLRQEQNQLQTQMNCRYQDMVDYYTIWAHQIKTPIAAMRLTLQNEDSKFSRQLSQELQRIEQYVEMVLAFLRLDSPVQDYVFRRQDLDEIVRDAVKKFAGSFIQKKLHLYYEPLNVSVLTDEKWLSFVVEQVISNAVKYTPSGGCITIDLEQPQVLCIRDNGIGIAPEDLPRVFEKSYTGYNGRSDKKASGIGLYLCRRICDNLGHQITIQSSLDSGTVVRIDLKKKKLQVE